MTDGKVHEYVITDEQLDSLATRLSEKVAEKAAERALEMMYADVGKTAVRKLLQSIGYLAIIALLFFAGQKAITH